MNSVLKRSRYLVQTYWPVLVLTVYVGVFFLQKINLVVSDLGRHLVNGQLITESGSVFATNFYSYTAPDFSAINHHWLYGVIVFYWKQLFGFAGLTLLNAALATVAFGGMVFTVAKKYGVVPATVAGVVIIPLLTRRAEVRPETFSVLFCAVFFVALSAVREKPRLFPFILSSLILMQIAWVNLHLFFVFGWVLVGLFWLESVLIFLVEKKALFLQQMSVLLLYVIVTNLINPRGIAGVFQPFGIFDNYSYMVAENQSVWFMIKRLGLPEYFYYAGLGPVVALAGVSMLGKKVLSQGLGILGHTKQVAQVVVPLSLFIIFWGLGFAINRVSSFAGLLSVPFIALMISRLYQQRNRLKSFFSATWVWMLGSPLLFGLVVLALWSNLFVPQWQSFGVGLVPHNTASTQFFREQNLQGPIFNNYDIGGFLIHELYPDERVFIDNRPEAYPSSLFIDEYIPGQERTDVWLTLLEQYDFNVIYFYRFDLTERAQYFLIERVKDPDWIPVFVDNYTIIFVRNIAQNQEVIDQFAIPNEMFGL